LSRYDAMAGEAMKRREFITLLGGAVALPVAAQAQQPAKMKRIAMVSTSDPVANMVANNNNRLYGAFFDEVSRLGFTEGKNLIVERYSAGGQIDRFAPLAREVVDTRPDVIYALSSTLGLAFKAATTTIPIVTLTSDPVAAGLTSNIARPGGNITGTSVDAGFDTWGKRIGLLKEALPKLSKVFIIADTRDRWEGQFGSAVRQAAKAASVTLNAAVFDEKFDEATYRRVFATFEQDRPDGLLVSDYGGHNANYGTILELVAKYRLPAMYAYRGVVQSGGLMSYGIDLEEIGRFAGYQIGQVLNGTNPGVIPFNQPTHYELTINLTTAKSLGIEFPATLLGSADFVVE
jgi:putative tryptophan/tyrosine transport system substrate-binding protein